MPAASRSVDRAALGIIKAIGSRDLYLCLPAHRLWQTSTDSGRAIPELITPDAGSIPAGIVSAPEPSASV